jgi:hypothetical protein
LAREAAAERRIEMTKWTVVPIGFLLVVGMACAAAAPMGVVGAPAWVAQTSFIDENGTICGVGVVQGVSNIALARSTASTRARREVAAVLEVYVGGYLEESQAATTDMSAGLAAEQQHTEAATREVVDQMMSGVVVDQLWQDPYSGAVYALARLSSADVLAALEQSRQLSAAVRERIRADHQAAMGRLDRLIETRKAAGTPRAE